MVAREEGNHAVQAVDPRRKDMDELKRGAAEICSLLVNTDYPEVDIAIMRNRLRERCEELFPDRMDLFDMIYESRFDRLWEQFHLQHEAAGW